MRDLLFIHPYPHSSSLFSVCFLFFLFFLPFIHFLSLVHSFFHSFFFFFFVCLFLSFFLSFFLSVFLSFFLSFFPPFLSFFFFISSLSICNFFLFFLVSSSFLFFLVCHVSCSSIFLFLFLMQFLTNSVIYLPLLLTMPSIVPRNKKVVTWNQKEKEKKNPTPPKKQRTCYSTSILATRALLFLRYFLVFKHLNQYLFKMDHFCHSIFPLRRPYRLRVYRSV